MDLATSNGDDLGDRRFFERGRIQDPSKLIDHGWSRAIQIVATVSSCLSLVGTLITVYWFFMMRRNFRRNLILYLVTADFFKSLWFLTFSLVALYRGHITTSTPLCQAFGFLLQASTMACDFAILIISVHMYLQIFCANSKIFGHDGLYRFRHTVTAMWFTFPTLTGLLAFVRGREAYLAQGPYCTLPVRPYWYRLALQWIPRYLIWLYIMFVAARIYLHVGQGFKVFAREEDKTLSEDAAGTDSAPQELQVVKKRAPAPGALQDVSGLIKEVDGSASPISQPPTSRQSNWPPPLNFSSDGIKIHSANHSRRGSQVVVYNPDGTAQAEHLQVPPEKTGRNSISTISSWRTSADLSLGQSLKPISEFNSVNGDPTDIRSADTPTKKRRRAIQRQIRLLFIYPITYLMVWLIPFVYYSMNYSDHYAAHPIAPLAMLTVFSVTIAGSVDCIVFGWREKPWQHVPGADGTFLGSFRFWQFKGNQRRNWSTNWSTPAPGRVPSIVAADTDPQETAQTSKKAKHLSLPSRQTSGNGSRPMVPMHKKTFSGNSDRATRAAEQAQERLAYERRDRQSRVPTRDSSTHAPGEWFERRLSECISPTKEKFGLDVEGED